MSVSRGTPQSSFLSSLLYVLAMDGIQRPGRGFMQITVDLESVQGGANDIHDKNQNARLSITEKEWSDINTVWKY